MISWISLVLVLGTSWAWAHWAQPMGPKSCGPGPGPGSLQLLGPMGIHGHPWAGPHGPMDPWTHGPMGPWAHGPWYQVLSTKYQVLSTKNQVPHVHIFNIGTSAASPEELNLAKIVFPVKYQVILRIETGKMISVARRTHPKPSQSPI